MSTQYEAFIKVTPKNSMADRRVDVVIKGLLCNKVVTIHSSCAIDNGARFECVAKYDTGCHGVIDLSKDCSIGGSYTGVEHGGILWAMGPSLQNRSQYSRFSKVDVTTPLVVHLCVYSEVIDSIEDLHKLRLISGKLNSVKIAETTFNRWYMAPGTKRTELNRKEHGIIGTMFLPPGEGPFPGVMVLFGGVEGKVEFKSALLASHGFASIVLSFFNVTGAVELPETFSFTGGNSTHFSINFDYFRNAVEYLTNHKSVLGSGIGLICISFSTGLSLMMTEVFPEIKSLVWINGFTQSCWTEYKYKNIEYKLAPYHLENVIINSNEIGILRNTYHLKEMPELTFKFYNQRNVAFLFIAGMDDANTPSDYYIAEAERLLKNADHPNYKILRYYGAGHLLEPAYAIHNRLSPQKRMPFKSMDWGGNRIDHCKAQNHSWPEQLSFLRNSLGAKITSKI